MSEDETLSSAELADRIRRRRPPGSDLSDEETVVGPPDVGWQEEPTQEWNRPRTWPSQSSRSIGASPSRGAGQRRSVPPPPPPRKRGNSWLAPTVVLLAFLVAAALVLFFRQSGGGTGSSHTSSGAVGRSASAPGSGNASTAALPGGTTTCTVASNESSTIAAAGQAVLTSGTFSCQFANAAIKDVQAEVRSQPKVTSFSISPYSRMEGKSYRFSCQRQSHLTTCTGKGHGAALMFSVQDAVGE